MTTKDYPHYLLPLVDVIDKEDSSSPVFTEANLRITSGYLQDSEDYSLLLERVMNLLLSLFERPSPLSRSGNCVPIRKIRVTMYRKVLDVLSNTENRHIYINKIGKYDPDTVVREIKKYLTDIHSSYSKEIVEDRLSKINEYVSTNDQYIRKCKGCLIGLVDSYKKAGLTIEGVWKEYSRLSNS